MEDVIYYNNLYDLYSNLLTDKQKNYFEDYYFNNLSLSEMAENYNVSRNAISKQLHNIVSKLIDYEEKLQLFSKKNKLLEFFDMIDNDDLKKKLEDVI